MNARARVASLVLAAVSLGRPTLAQEEAILPPPRLDELEAPAPDPSTQLRLVSDGCTPVLAEQIRQAFAVEVDLRRPEGSVRAGEILFHCTGPTIIISVTLAGDPSVRTTEMEATDDGRLLATMAWEFAFGSGAPRDAPPPGGRPFLDVRRAFQVPVPPPSFALGVVSRAVSSPSTDVALWGVGLRLSTEMPGGGHTSVEVTYNRGDTGTLGRGAEVWSMALSVDLPRPLTANLVPIASLGVRGGLIETIERAGLAPIHGEERRGGFLGPAAAASLLYRLSSDVALMPTLELSWVFRLQTKSNRDGYLEGPQLAAGLSVLWTPGGWR